MKAQVCPICDGKGVVRLGFYPNTDSTANEWPKCRACHGTGYIMCREECHLWPHIRPSELERRRPSYPWPWKEDDWWEYK